MIKDKCSIIRLCQRLTTLILAIAIGIAIPSSVMANTIEMSVIDGEKIYRFAIDTKDSNAILQMAYDLGMPTLSTQDKSEWIDNTTVINIHRGVNFELKIKDKIYLIQASIGDTLEEAIANSNIPLDSDDEISVDRTMLLTKSLDQVEIKRKHAVTVLTGDKITHVAMMDGTVRDALTKAEVSLSEDDIVNFSLNEPLFDNMLIRVLRRKHIKVIVDKSEKTYIVAGTTVQDALKEIGIALSEQDRVEPAVKTNLQQNQAITIKRVKHTDVVEKTTIPFETIYEDSSELYIDEQKIKTDGVDGEKREIYRITYVDDVEESRELKSSEVISAPTPEIILKGTKSYPVSEEKKPADIENASPTTQLNDNTIYDASGSPLSYKSVLTGMGTAYCLTGTTATGSAAGYGNVAVDPSVIPYGTRLYIRSADGAFTYGYCVAADTGGALLSGRVLVDLWYPTEDECSSFGRREIEVYILE